MDRGPKNKKHIKEFIERYGIKRVVISVYNSKANSIIERGYRSIVNTLTKMTDRGEGD